MPRLLAALGLTLLTACGDAGTCGASGGRWDPDCGGAGPWCVDGKVDHSDRPAVCTPGCDCPPDAPIWHSERGCISEEECASSS